MQPHYLPPASQMTLGIGFRDILRSRPCPHPGGPPRGTLTGTGPQRRGLARRSSALPAAGPRSHSQTPCPHSATNNTLRAFLSGFCKRRKPRAQAQGHRYARGRGLHGSRARGTGASRRSWDLGSGGCPCREAVWAAGETEAGPSRDPTRRHRSRSLYTKAPRWRSSPGARAGVVWG